MFFSQAPMNDSLQSRNWLRVGFAFCSLLLLFWLVDSFSVLASAERSATQDQVMHIGTTVNFSQLSGVKEEDARAKLREFIKQETNFDNDINSMKNWIELGSKLTAKEMQFGIFQGYEFAWASERFPSLKPLVIAVKVERYPAAYVMAKSDNKATTLAGLKGQSMAIPRASQGFPRFFLERETLGQGAKLSDFFSKVTTPDELEDGLDDIVDGIVDACVVDQAGLEAYERRKPGRFEKLKQVVKSQPFPSHVVAYDDKDTDVTTRDQFRAGLLGAGDKDLGPKVLNLFKLTAFEAPRPDFDKILRDVRAKYPAPNEVGK
jgi:ABC-type phosphate/phosphonate transport system substrate-binding protein